MTREELITGNAYIKSQIQLSLLNVIGEYMQSNNLKRKQLAEELNVTKGYVTQILNAEYDHKISKLVELSLACNKIPLVYFIDKEKFVSEDKKDKFFELFPVQRPKNVTYSEITANTKNVFYLDEKSNALLGVQV